MKNLETFLNAYKMNLEYFDISSFEDEIMDIPYQVKILKENFEQLTSSQKILFLELTQELKNRIENVEIENNLEKKIIFSIKEVI